MCEVSPDLNPQDLEFITDIARILVVAQRQLSYAYVARYYLTGQKKQEFMDFQLVQLESYVDYYKQKVQERWVDKLEIGNTGAFTVMSKDFCAYKNAMLKAVFFANQYEYMSFVAVRFINKLREIL